MHMTSETLSVSAIVFCICLPINRKNKRQFNFLPLVKYLYFIFRITPTIDKEPIKNRKRKNPSESDGFHYVGISLFFRAVTSQVFSAPLSLTSVFGMGTGGPSASSTPTV